VSSSSTKTRRCGRAILERGEKRRRGNKPEIGAQTERGKSPREVHRRRTAVALVYVSKALKESRISKAIRQCCAIDDAFCLTQSLDAQIFAH